MSELLNGAGKVEPLAGWVIVLAAGRSLLGKEDGPYLSPVYELQARMQEGPQGVAIGHVVMPLLLLSSIRKLDVSTAPITIKVDDLSPTERKSLAGAVLRCDDMLRAMRLADSGLVAVPAGATVSKLVKP